MLTPELERALLESLDQSPDHEVRPLWIEEARRRADEIDQGKVEMISGEELERQVQELLEPGDEVAGL